MTPKARVATRWLYAQDSGKPLTPAYLKKALTFMEARNADESSPWAGSWGAAIAEVARMARVGIEGLELALGRPPTVADLMARLERVGLDEALIAEFEKGVTPPRAPVTPRVMDEAALEDLRVKFQQALPSGVRVLWHRPDPAHAKNALAWLKLFERVAKYPTAATLLGKVIRVVELDSNPSRAAEASYLMGRITLNLKSGVPNLGTLIHELGHAFEDTQPDQQAISSWKHLYGNPPFSHGYMEERAVEDFAECFKQFHLERAALKAKAPAKFEDMAQRVTR